MATIHSSAVIHPGAQIGADCDIGPYCIVGEYVTLGAGCRLHSHVVVDGHTKLGSGNEIFPFAAIGMKTQDLKWKGGVTSLEIGDRNVFREGVTVHCSTSEDGRTVIGSNNLLLIYAHVVHDCMFGNNIIMSGFAGLAGHVHVEDNAILSGYVAIHQFCRIGKYAMIGACCRVRQDIPPYLLADGDPATPLTINKVGLERAGMSEETINALRSAYKILYREGLTIPNALARIEKDLPPLPEVQYLVRFVRASERGISK